MTLKAVQERKKPLGLMWVRCPYPVLAQGLEEALSRDAWVHIGNDPPGSVPRCIIVCVTSPEETEKMVREARLKVEDVPIIVFGMTSELALVRASLKSGARGFVHLAMDRGQIVRAISVAIEGEVVIPRDLLKELIVSDAPVKIEHLTTRQIEILELVVEGKTNAQIGRQLYLSESTIKQHLRAAFKSLGVSNRTEASKLLRGMF